MGSNYTKAGREALRAFDRVIARQGETKESAKATSQDIVDAYVSAYAELQTAAEKADLNAGLRKALKEQRISLAEYNKAISEASNATREFVDIQKEATAILIGANEELENTGENTEEAAARGSGAAASLAEVIASLSERMGGLSDAARQAFDQAVFGKLKTIGTDAGETGNRIKELSQSIKNLDEDIINSFDATGLVDYQLELKRTADEIERSFLEQQDAVNRVNQKYDDGKLSLEQYIRLLKQARGAADLLDQAELDNITQSIQAAREEMESFRESTLSSVNSLKQELLSLNGSKLEQENFDFRLRELDLQEKLAEARRTGDAEAIANAEEALKIARDIHELKVKDINDREKAEKAKADEERAAKEEQEQADKRKAVADKKAAEDKEKQRKAEAQAREREEQERKTEAARESLRQQQQAREQQRQKEFKNRTASQRPDQLGQVNRSHDAVPTTIIRLEAPSGQGVNVYGDDPQAVIEVLQEAGRRTR